MLNLKPYLKLDVTQPTIAKHAKMALRMLRPWHGESEDPLALLDAAAVAQVEEFAISAAAPRWFRKRFLHHNRRCKRAAAMPSTCAHKRTSGEEQAGGAQPRKRLRSTMARHETEWYRAAAPCGRQLHGGEA